MRLRIGDKYTKSILTLASGSLIGQLITVIAAPLTTRLFTTEELGIYTLILTATTMLGPVLALRYDMAIVVETDDQYISDIVLLSILLTTVVSILSGIGYGIYYCRNMNGFTGVAVIVGTLNFIAGLLNIIISCNNRQKKYRLMAMGYTFRMAVQNIGMVFAGMLGAGVGGIVCAQLLGYLISIVIQLQRSDDLCSAKRAHGWECLFYIGKKYKKQALFSTPAALLNGLSYSIINFFVASLYGTPVLGLYSVSYRVLGLPSSIISTNISKVFFEKASREYEEKGEFQRSFLVTLLLLGILALPLLILLIFLAPGMFGFIFGEDWKEAGRFVQILAPMFVLRFAVGGVNCSAIIAGKQKMEFYIQSAMLISGIAIYIGVRTGGFGIETYLKAINIVYSAIYVIYILIFKNCSEGGKHEKI